MRRDGAAGGAVRLGGATPDAAPWPHGLLALVRERAEAGEPLPVIARTLGLPLDLAEQMLSHFQRLGQLTVLGQLPHTPAAGAGPAGCREPDRLACAGCFFSRACPSRH